MLVKAILNHRPNSITEIYMRTQHKRIASALQDYADGYGRSKEVPYDQIPARECCLSDSTLAACQSAESLQREREQAAWERSLTPDQRVRLEEARLRALGWPCPEAPSSAPRRRRIRPRCRIMDFG